MRDFNDLLAQDRTFKVRDKTFTFVDVKPEVLTLFDAEAAVNAGNGKSDSEDTLVWRLLDAQIMLFLTEEGKEAWKELRARESEPVTIAQMNAVLEWLMEEQTGRPTQAPSPSASGRGRTAATSKAA